MQISSRASFPEGEIVVTRNPYKANWQAMQARGTCIVDLFIYWRNWSCHRFVTTRLSGTRERESGNSRRQRRELRIEGQSPEIECRTGVECMICVDKMARLRQGLI